MNIFIWIALVITNCRHWSRYRLYFNKPNFKTYIHIYGSEWAIFFKCQCIHLQRCHVSISHVYTVSSELPTPVFQTLSWENSHGDTKNNSDRGEDASCVCICPRARSIEDIWMQSSSFAPLGDLEPWLPHLQVLVTSPVVMGIKLITQQRGAPVVKTVQLGVMVLV